MENVSSGLLTPVLLSSCTVTVQSDLAAFLAAGLCHCFGSEDCYHALLLCCDVVRYEGRPRRFNRVLESLENAVQNDTVINVNKLMLSQHICFHFGHPG